MSQVINFPDAYHWVQDVQLSGRVYSIECRWNFRTENWLMSVSVVGGVKLVQNIKLVLNYPLLYGHRHIAELPPGEFIIIPTSSGVRDNPSLSSFREDRMRLLYVI